MLVKICVGRLRLRATRLTRPNVRRSCLDPGGNFCHDVFWKLASLAAGRHCRFDLMGDKFIQQAGLGITGNDGGTSAATLEKPFAGGKIQTRDRSFAFMTIQALFLEQRINLLHEQRRSGFLTGGCGLAWRRYRPAPHKNNCSQGCNEASAGVVCPLRGHRDSPLSVTRRSDLAAHAAPYPVSSILQMAVPSVKSWAAKLPSGRIRHGLAENRPLAAVGWDRIAIFPLCRS